MNFQQLKIIRETVRKNYNLTEVGNALFTSQSGVSKNIKELEEELGVELFVRKGKRLLGLTEPGKELLTMIERVLIDAQNIKKIAEHFSKSDEGQLTIATTHTQARYVLPQVVSAFKKDFPKVHLTLHQGSPREIAEMLIDGRADLGIATESLDQVPELINFPYYGWHHTVIVPQGHPLTGKTLRLKDLVEYPIVTYHPGFTGRQTIDETFLKADLNPDIVMSAMDADVLKTYVELGMGIGIIASMAYQEGREGNLTRLDSAHLFEEKMTRIAIRKGHYLRDYAYRFLQLCVADLSEDKVRAAVAAAMNG